MSRVIIFFPTLPCVVEAITRTSGGAFTAPPKENLMSKKTEMSPVAKQNVNQEYHKLQARWVEEIDRPATNWENLFFLHFEMAMLESRAKWLKKETEA